MQKDDSVSAIKSLTNKKRELIMGMSWHDGHFRDSYTYVPIIFGRKKIGRANKGTIDHIIPLSIAQDLYDHPDNLQALSWRENIVEKNDRLTLHAQFKCAQFGFWFSGMDEFRDRMRKAKACYDQHGIISESLPFWFYVQDGEKTHLQTFSYDVESGTFAGHPWESLLLERRTRKLWFLSRYLETKDYQAKRDLSQEMQSWENLIGKF